MLLQYNIVVFMKFIPEDKGSLEQTLFLFLVHQFFSFFIFFSPCLAFVNDGRSFKFLNLGYEKCWSVA
jgi:hypothetical protein